MENITVITPQCPRCGARGEVVVPKINYEKWKSGEILYVQNAFAFLDAGLREQLMTGYHDYCFDLDFAELEEDEADDDDEAPF